LTAPRRAAAGLLVLYGAFVALVTVVPMRVPIGMPRHRTAPWWAVVELVPFHVPLWSFALNVVLFVPLGVLVPLACPRGGSLVRIAAGSLAASGAIEVTQLVLWVTLANYRTVDVNDLIANTAGGVLGRLVLRFTPVSRRGCSRLALSRWWSCRRAAASSTPRDLK
jgi:glycopeptide antibiotics resistance protein